jgi:flagella basal body P-ring formation protein FlgA
MPGPAPARRAGPAARALRAGLAGLALLAAPPAAAETLVALRTIRAQTVIGPGDVGLAPGVTPGALTQPEQALGLEARVALYPGRPIHPADLGPPALVERNARVTLVFRSGALTITAEGRALSRAAAGEAVRVMNLSSRATVTGTVEPDGRVAVAALPLP